MFLDRLGGSTLPVTCATRPAAVDTAGLTQSAAVVLSHHGGQIGNKLFAVAAGVALAVARTLPLAMPRPMAHEIARRAGFECVWRSALDDANRTRVQQRVQPSRLTGGNYQDVSLWGLGEPDHPATQVSRSQVESGTDSCGPEGVLKFCPQVHTQRWLPIMRDYFLPLVMTRHERKRAVLDTSALLIHFRDTRDHTEESCKQQARTLLPQNPDVDLYAPPVEFYRFVIDWHRRHISQHAKVFIVGLSCVRNHSTVRALLATDEGVSFVSDQSARVDFLRLLSARHVVLSISTFSWWAAFLSPHVQTVHYPLFPAHTPWGPNSWCNIMPEDDPRCVSLVSAGPVLCRNDTDPRFAERATSDSCPLT